MIRLDVLNCSVNALGDAWMLDKSGKAISVDAHVYGIPGDLFENVGSTLWILVNEPDYEKKSELLRFLTDFACWIAYQRSSFSTDRETIDSSIREYLGKLDFNLGELVDWSVDEVADFLISLLNKFDANSIDEIGESVNDNSGDFIISELNENFVRVRMNDRYNRDDYNGDCYFRIGSKYSDWTDIIWQFVHDNPKIETIWVERDRESDGNRRWNARNVLVDGMSREDFLSGKIPCLCSKKPKK